MGFGPGNAARLGHQNHHLIPVQLQGHPIFAALNGHGIGFDIDDPVNNRIELPNKVATAFAQALSLAPSSTHTSSHSAYTDMVERILDSMLRDFPIVSATGLLQDPA